MHNRFKNLKLTLEAFSSLHYVGTRTVIGSKTDFTDLLQDIKVQIENTSVRQPRSPKIVFKSLQVLFVLKIDSL